MTVTPRSARTRSRTLAAVSGLAALALALGACGEEGEAEQAVGEATSAVGSVAAEATSAVGDAMNDGGEGGEGGATTGNGPQPEGSEEGGGESPNPDEEFLNDIQRVGVDTPDEQDYITRGRDACASFDEGTGYIDVLQMYNDAHPDAPVIEAPAVVTAAVKAYCSQHLPLVGDGGENGGGENGGGENGGGENSEGA
ncbi:Protein of unknown function [Dietzia kunjamensis subsp. schimae]|uniref:DUF732 domain-containing protein n=1 Tax=Dietzia kunjamensis subsp. schimae TaxID=498198 RepID=A0ABY1N1K9_9ACTN|nr:DUF732 domain-containing protein [Dietzia kunjamensis]MBB1013976.1 DUF732 domain-containing protein [Dietzia kunjamensis subsp. schimae]SMO73188.1 Protein of unknown function [Dietzia kunjamensis subsp. schimae]